MILLTRAGRLFAVGCGLIGLSCLAHGMASREISGGDVTFIEGMKCHTIQIPSFAHPCHCFTGNSGHSADPH
jgi:hypothetical protein